MRTYITLCLFLAVLTAAAQPDDWMVRFTNPCGMPPNDSLDLTGDGIPDLEIGGWSVGTDDEPSSSGSCTRYVRPLPGTTLLCGLNHAGDRVAQAFHLGDTVPSWDTKVPNDLQIPRFVYTDAAIIVLQWGYGHQAGNAVPTPDLEMQVFVFQTNAPYERRLGTFTLQPLVDLRNVRITVGALVHADEALIIR